MRGAASTRPSWKNPATVRPASSDSAVNDATTCSTTSGYVISAIAPSGATLSAIGSRSNPSSAALILFQLRQMPVRAATAPSIASTISERSSLVRSVERVARS